MFSVICFEMIVFCFQSRILWSTSLDRHVDVGLSNHNVGLRIISELQCKHTRAHRATTSKKQPIELQQLRSLSTRLNK